MVTLIFKNLKAQAATEYLIMLSIILVIVLTSVMLFTNIPSMVSHFSSSGHKDFWSNAEISVRSNSLYSNKEFHLNIRNNKAAPIKLTKIILDNTEYPVSYEFEPGEKKIITIPLSQEFNEGAPYSFKLGFEYIMLEQEFKFTPNVLISGSVQGSAKD